MFKNVKKMIKSTYEDKTKYEIHNTILSFGKKKIQIKQDQDDQEKEVEKEEEMDYKSYSEDQFEMTSIVEDKLNEKNLPFTKLKGQFAIKCLQVQLKYNQSYANAKLFLTNARIYFDMFQNKCLREEERKNYFNIYLGFINHIDKTVNKSKSQIKLEIELKDYRSFKIRTKYQKNQEITKIYKGIKYYGLNKNICKLFAFEHAKFIGNQEKCKGWNFQIQKEFLRQGLIIQQSPYKILNNSSFNICNTYPQKLVVPKKINEQDIQICANFRSRKRLPVMTYYYKNKGKCIFRSSQNKVGIKTRCKQDENMLRLIGNPYEQINKEFLGNKNLHIYDARPRINAESNRLEGKGYEFCNYYKNCYLQFLNIPNIHVIRNSYKTVMIACLRNQNKNFLQSIYQSKYLEYISLILLGAKKIVSSLTNGYNVLIHCSDGWDRTAQLASLAQIIIDPYFRTIQGFITLIKKDWFAFGHQFNSRYLNGNNNQHKSPVFHQFLDCVHQILTQYPCSFQFNIKFLKDILYYMFTNRFGNFLIDCEFQSYKNDLKYNTISLWSYMKERSHKYQNVFYSKNADQAMQFLNICCEVNQMRLWQQHFCYFSKEFKDKYQLNVCEFTQQNKSIIYQMSLKQNKFLKESLEEYISQRNQLQKKHLKK